MLIVHVHVRVQAGLVDEFIRATLENARSSVQELGIARSGSAKLTGVRLPGF